MSSFFGLNPESIIKSIGGALASIAPAPPPDGGFQPGQAGGEGGFAPAPVVAGNNAWPTVTLGPDAGFQPAQMQLGGFSPAGGGYGGFQPSAMGYAGFEPSGAGYAGFQPSAFNPLLDPTPPPGTTAPGTSGQNPQGGGLNFAGPATADDNKALTGQQIDEYIRRTKPNSPLVGMGQFILNEANQRGVSVPLLIGIMTLESQLGSDGSYLPSVYNYGGLTGTGWAGQTGSTTGMARAFATFSSKEAGVAALIANLASSLYKGKSVQQQIGTWYLGDPNAAMNATDEHGNASMAQYLNVIANAYNGLGVNYNQSQGGTPVAGGVPRGQGTPNLTVGRTPWAEAPGILAVGQQFLGNPYVWGGESPQEGFDCSGLVQWSLAQVGIRDAPRTAQQQYNWTQRIGANDLRPGDLVFFTNTYQTNEAVTHVGIFAGYDASGRPVMLNSASGGILYAYFDDPYWSSHLYGYGRIPNTGPGGRP